MIAAGTILIQKGALHPAFFSVGDDGYPDGWMSVSHDFNPRQLSSALGAAGWTFSYQSKPLSRRAFGFDRPEATRRALRRVIGKARGHGCNCIEVYSVALRSFLGIPYVRISAHLCQIQKGPFLVRS